MIPDRSIRNVGDAMAGRDDSRNPWRAYALVSGIGLQMAFCVLLGLFGGKWLDGVLGTSPWFLLLGLLLGLAAGIWGIVVLAKQFSGESE